MDHQDTGSNSPTRHICKCEIEDCGQDLFGCMRYDGRTSNGSWRVMCHRCWLRENGKLGINIAQKYDPQGRCVAGNKVGELLIGLPEAVTDLESYLGKKK